MQERRLRLGDRVDDYCPSERRITDHAVVAMVSGEIKQTRCTTCDAEHEYKAAKMPRLRKPRLPATDAVRSSETEVAAEAGSTPVTALDGSATDETPLVSEPISKLSAGSVHRSLIRATLPRVEGQVPERRIPEFTIRQSNTRNGNGRDGNGRGSSGKRHLGNGGRANGNGIENRSREQDRFQDRTEPGNRRRGRSSGRSKSRLSRSTRREKKPS